MGLDVGVLVGVGVGHAMMQGISNPRRAATENEDSMKAISTVSTQAGEEFRSMCSSNMKTHFRIHQIEVLNAGKQANKQPKDPDQKRAFPSTSRDPPPTSHLTRHLSLLPTLSHIHHSSAITGIESIATVSPRQTIHPRHEGRELQDLLAGYG